MWNKKGEGYIQTSVLIIVICMILSVFITFVSSVNVIKLVERNTKTVLESYVMKNSVIIYNSIKQGNDETEFLDTDEFINDLKSFCTFVKEGNFMYAKYADGKTKYYISNPEIGFTNENKLKLYVSYKLYVPIYFNGVYMSTVIIPTTVKINLNEKF